MNEREQLDEIKIIVGKAKNSFNEFGETDYSRQDELILSIFDDGKLDWLIEKAGQYDEVKQDAMNLYKQNKRYRERLNEIKELATKHLNLNLDMRTDVILDIVNEALEGYE